MRRPCSDAVRLFAAAAAALALTVAAARADIDISPRDAAIVRINVIDLLANEQRLPLPIKQRREVLQAYYQANNGALLWLGTKRAGAFVARLLAADTEGLDPKDYPGKQLGELNEESPTLDKRQLAIVELYFSAALLEYTSDLRVGRVLPGKVDPDFFVEGRVIDQLAALKYMAQAASVDAYFAAWQPQHAIYALLRTALAHYRALATMGGWSSGSARPHLASGRIRCARAGDPRAARRDGRRRRGGRRPEALRPRAGRGRQALPAAHGP